MRQHEKELDELDLGVKVVSFDADALALAYVRESELPWPLLLDVDKRLYREYGMTRGSWWRIYGPVSIWNYLKLFMQGKKPGKPGEDWRQLGGDVLIDPQGTVRILYVSTSPHDRPSVNSILNFVRRNSGTTAVSR